MHIPNLIQAWENERSGFFPLITQGIPSFRALLLGHTPFSMSLLSQLLILLSSLVVFRLQIGFLCSHFYFRRSWLQTLYPHLLVFFFEAFLFFESIQVIPSFQFDLVCDYSLGIQSHLSQLRHSELLSQLGVQSCFLSQAFKAISQLGIQSHLHQLRLLEPLINLGSQSRFLKILEPLHQLRCSEPYFSVQVFRTTILGVQSHISQLRHLQPLSSKF